ncbi:hypothetical protein SGCOL_006432 [Colletotrichum sp. CLE4]
MVRQTRASTRHNDSSDAENASPKAQETRRSHKKSRNGCAECKRRHIRCDERQPSCANCEVAERACFFPSPKVSKQKRRQEQLQLRSEKPQSPLTPSLASPMLLSGNHAPPSLECDDTFSILGTPNALSEAIYTPQHMILLHHASSVPNFTGPARSAVDIAVRRAVNSPYLLDEVLAFTAFHMIHLYPGSADHLRHLATELQNRALSSFTRLTETVPKDDKATAVPRFLFSAILGRHVLADTLAHYRSDFKSFIDRLVECFNLNRGVTSVTPPARYYLQNTEISPFLNIILEAAKKMGQTGDECGALRRLLDDSDLSEASTEACREVIELLQWCFDICHVLDEEDYPQAASTFSVKVPVGFVDMLRKHRPEALLILAHYGVLMHRCRGFWPFADAGAFIIRAIARHLGSYWQEALAWPLDVLETEGICVAKSQETSRGLTDDIASGFENIL